MATRPLSRWKRFAQILPLAGMLWMTAGWTHQLQAPTRSPELSQQLIQKFDALAKGSSGFVQLNLDLSDPADWEFLQGRLRSAGKNEKNAPELFKRMDFMRERALARRASGVVALDDEQEWCNHFIKWDAESETTEGATTFYPKVEVACKDGADYVYTDLLNVDANLEETEGVVVSGAAGEEYGGGLMFDLVTVPATVSPNATVYAAERVLLMDSVMFAATDTLEQASYIVERIAVSDEPAALTLTHPRKLQTNQPRAEILACQMRGNAADCDYSVAGYSGSSLQPYPYAATGIAAHYSNSTSLNPSDYWNFGTAYNSANLYVPLRGMLTAGAANGFQCTIQSIDRARIQLIASVTGRTCYNEANFVASVPVGGTISSINVLNNINYLFNIAGSGTSPDSCAAETLINEMTRYNVLISGKRLCGGVISPFYITYPRPDQGTANILFLNSCMAEGTSIQLADGTVVPVEQVKEGDKVIADTKGTVLTVTGLSTGNENKAMLRLRDDAGHDVTLTEAHPVITASGKVVAAKNVKLNDKLKTSKGVTTLTSIDRVSPEQKRVFNLKLGTDQELLAVGSQGRTMFAGGFLVGDSTMQEELEAVRAPAPVAVLKRLPKAWHKDFQNSSKAR